jgi:hypothetical protein
MAEPNTTSDVFKFVALRPPAPPSKDAADQEFIRDDRPASETPVGRFLGQFTAANAASLPDKIKSLVKEKKYDLAYPQSDGNTDLDAVEAAVRGVPPNSISAAKLITAIKNATDKTLKDLYSNPKPTELRRGVWDRYYAFYVLGRFEPQNLEKLTRNLRIFHLLRLLSTETPIPGPATLDRILSATPVVDKLFTDLPKPEPSKPPTPGRVPSKETEREYRTLWSDLVNTHNALEDIRRLKLTSTVETHTETVKVAPPRTARTRVARVSEQTRMNSRIKVDPQSFTALQPHTKKLLTALQFDEKTINKAETVEALNARMVRLSDTVASISDPQFLSYAPLEAKQIPGLFNIASHLDKYLKVPPFPIWPKYGNVRNLIKPLGIGDLKVVKQKLKSYQMGEVAHIENVLRGEYKERKFRVLDRTEEIVTVSEETQEETIKDTQTTERFELKKESENTIQEQMSVQAGVTVSGSYGMVTFGAHGDFAYSTSSQESTKNSSNFAREVVDKSVTRIQKNVKQERVTKKLHEVEELDTHGLDNKDKPDHITGIYRWVDKYYEAQIYNYGRRMMFEFIIPEPSAFLQYAQTHQPKKDIKEPVPLPTWLTHKNITEWNYQTYIRDYQIQGALPPPPTYKVVSVTLSSDAQIQNGTALSKASKELLVPEGYECENLAASLSVIFENNPQVKISVGVDEQIWYTVTDTDARQRFDWVGGTVGAKYDSVIPVAINCYDLNSYFVTVIATCARTWQKYETWQIQTFEKITAAYMAMKASYDQQIAQRDTQQGVAIHGQNPRINREIEKNELKKSSVKLLMDTWQFGSFDAMKQANVDDPPDFDIFDAVDEGKVSQFFEQAFEWENITYLFYPYMWGRYDQWISKINTYDEDPLFTKFLQAGAARVVVPVHPGYNDAVMYFLENNGAIWGGGEPPRLNDPLFISLADELRAQTDDLANATAEGDPWQVILPTTLVYLQKDATLPVFP